MPVHSHSGLWSPVSVPDALGPHAARSPPGDLTLAAAHRPWTRQKQSGDVW